MKLAKTPKWLRRTFGRAIRRQPEVWKPFGSALRVMPAMGNRRENLSRLRRFTLNRIVKVIR